MRAKAEEYGVSENLMVGIIGCESQWSTTIQSNHRYTTNAPKGYKPGDREQSYGLVQIHLPAHPHITKEQATDPEFAIEFLAKNIADGRQAMWTCARQIAMR